MGVFSKLKNIFYDEEVIEEKEDDFKKIDRDIRREVEKPKIEEIKVIKQEPIHEEEKVENKIEDTTDFGDRELFRRERKFNFTELDDEEELPPRKSVLNTETRVNKVEVKETPQTTIETPKVFKPSPVISPIYGILDKDYKKEEIVSKKTEVIKELDSPAQKYDSVRRKAYGTLEDDLEDTLNSMNRITPQIIKSEVQNINNDVDDLEEKSNKIEEIINKIEKTTVSVGELEDKLELEHFDEDDEEESNDKTMADSTLEHDLFNLIDSMYDDKEE